ncbi:MAG: sulfotransferase family 2 domain-containing protein [Pseudomonadota bacterium]
MILSKGRRLIFIHIPKTGGTSLAAAYETRAMADDILVGDTPKARARRGRLCQFQPRGRLWKHSTLADIDGLPGTDDLGAMYLVTLVRNPWDRLVSYYAWARDQRFEHPAVSAAKTLEFQSFVRDPGVSAALHAAPARHYVTDANGRERQALFARLEHLDSDLDPLWDHLGFTLELPKLNTSDRRPDYRSYYDPSTADHVARLLAEDIERFNYRF